MFAFYIYTLLLFGVKVNGINETSLLITNIWGDELPRATLGLTTSTDRPDLPNLIDYMGSQTIGTCSQNCWIIYFNANYTNGAYGGFPTICSSFSGFGFPKSVRRIGNSDFDMSKPSLHLYGGYKFSLNTTSYDEKKSNIPEKFPSFLIFGDENVQLYEGYEQTGISYCVPISKHRYCDCTRIENIMSIGIQPGTIRSYKFGCTDPYTLVKHVNGISSLGNGIYDSGNGYVVRPEQK